VIDPENKSEQVTLRINEVLFHTKDLGTIIHALLLASIDRALMAIIMASSDSSALVNDFESFTAEVNCSDC